MKKLLLFAGTVVAIAVCVFIASRAYSDWKLRGLLFDSFGRIPELKRWEYSTVSFNFFSKYAVISGLQFYLENGGSIYIGKISGVLDGTGRQISVTDIKYSNAQTRIAIAAVNCADGSLADLAAVNWSEIISAIEPKTVLIGRWSAPPLLFKTISIAGLEYGKEPITLLGEEIRAKFNKNAGEEVYSVRAENMSLRLSDRTLFFIDNITAIKSYNIDKNSFEEFLTVNSENFASLTLQYTAGAEDNKLKVLRLSYLDRSFLYSLASIYKFLGGSVGQENQWLLTESFSAFMSNILGSQITGKLELMESIFRFLEKPESFDLDIDGEGNANLSFNGEKPILINVRPQSEEIPMEPPNSGVSEFEAGEFEAEEEITEDPPENASPGSPENGASEPIEL
jgi:hypothetical protein